MIKEEYTVNIGNLKVSGPIEEIFELSKVFEHAAKDYYNNQTMLSKVHDSKYNELINTLKQKQHQLEEINKELDKTVSKSEYYKQYLSERNQITKDIVENLLKEDEYDER